MNHNCLQTVIFFFSSVQALSHVWLFATPCTAARQASLSITNSQSLLKLMSVKLVMLFNHLVLCRPLLLPPSIFPTTPCIAATHVERVNQQAARCPRCRSSIHDYQMNKYNEQKAKGVDQWFFKLQELQGYDESYGLSSPTHTYSILCGISGTLQTSWSLVMAPQVDRHQYKAFSSVQFSRSVVSDSLQPHEPQHTGHKALLKTIPYTD